MAWPYPRGLVLRNEPHRAREVAGGLGVARLVTGPHHDADLPDIRREGLLDQDAENGFLHSVVDESLQRKRPLIRSRRCDDRLPHPQHKCPSSVFSHLAATSVRERVHQLRRSAQKVSIIADAESKQHLGAHKRSSRSALALAAQAQYNYADSQSRNRDSWFRSEFWFREATRNEGRL